MNDEIETPETRRPIEWAKAKGLCIQRPRKGAKAARDTVAAVFKVADLLHGWSDHDYNNQRDLFQLTGEVFDRAIRAAIDFPTCQPCKEAQTPKARSLRGEE